MGTCYYLWRDDNKTAYDLGKAWRWGEMFGGSRHSSISTPMTLAPQDAPELAELLVAHLTAEGDEASLDYCAFVCADIARWSQGQAFEFVSEHDHRYENACMDAYDRGGHGSRDDVVTGSRFDSWLKYGPRCACEEPKITDGFGPAYCLACQRYKMCPICGEHAVIGAVACDKHRHRAGRKDA